MNSEFKPCYFIFNILNNNKERLPAFSQKIH